MYNMSFSVLFLCNLIVHLHIISDGKGLFIFELHSNSSFTKIYKCIKKVYNYIFCGSRFLTNRACIYISYKANQDFSGNYVFLFLSFHTRNNIVRSDSIQANHGLYGIPFSFFSDILNPIICF